MACPSHCSWSPHFHFPSNLEVKDANPEIVPTPHARPVLQFLHAAFFDGLKILRLIDFLRLHQSLLVLRSLLLLLLDPDHSHSEIPVLHDLIDVLHRVFGCIRPWAIVLRPFGLAYYLWSHVGIDLAVSEIASEISNDVQIDDFVDHDDRFSWVKLRKRIVNLSSMRKMRIFDVSFGSPCALEP